MAVITQSWHDAWFRQYDYRFMGFGHDIGLSDWAGQVAVIIDRPPTYGAVDVGFEEMRWTNGAVNYKAYKLVEVEPGVVQAQFHSSGTWNSLSHTDAYGDTNIFNNNFEVLFEDGSLMHAGQYGHDYSQYNPPTQEPKVDGAINTEEEIIFNMDDMFDDSIWDFGGSYPTLVQDSFITFNGSIRGTRITIDQARMRSTYESQGWDFETGWNIIEFLTFPYLIEPNYTEAFYEDAFPVKLPIGLCHIKYYSGSSHPIKLQLDGKVVRVGIVELTHASASPIKVMTPIGLMALEMAETRDQIGFNY